MAPKFPPLLSQKQEEIKISFMMIASMEVGSILLNFSEVEVNSDLATVRI